MNIKKAFFFKVDSNTSLTSLIIKTKKSVVLCKKPLSYNIIHRIALERDSYNCICKRILNSSRFINTCYYMSKTNNSGIRNCIELTCEFQPYRIIVYTSGQTIPIYAAIISNF